MQTHGVPSFPDPTATARSGCRRGSTQTRPVPEGMAGMQLAPARQRASRGSSCERPPRGNDAGEPRSPRPGQPRTGPKRRRRKLAVGRGHRGGRRRRGGPRQAVRRHAGRRRPRAPTDIPGARDRQSLSSQTSVNATLGYAGSYTVVVPPAGSQPQGSGQQGDSPSGSAQSGGASGSGGQGQAAGTFTALPSAGQVVRQGQSRVFGQRVPTVAAVRVRPRVPQPVGGHER